MQSSQRSQECLTSRPVAPRAALAQLWQAAGQPAEALSHIRLTGTEPVLPSSFAVGTAAQASIAASALAASDLWQAAGHPAEALSHIRLTGTEPVLPSSFAVGTAAQASIAASALAASELW